MKVLMVNSVPTGRNGITGVVFNFIEAFPKGSVELGYVAINEPDVGFRHRLEKACVSLHIIPRELRHPLRYVKELINVACGYDAIHVHGNSATLVLEMMAAKYAGVPLRIAHSHNSNCSMHLIHRTMWPLFQSLCNCRLSCSDKAGRWLFGKREFTVINNGIDTARYAFNKEKRETAIKEIGGSGPVVGHVGNFDYAKNHPFILQIFAELKKHIPDATLLLVGGGEAMPRFQTMVCGLGIQDSVVFTGSISDTSPYISAMDIVLMPSYYEGMPLTLVEEQANGLQCVVSDAITRNADLTGNLTFLSLSDPIKKWVETITAILKNSQEREKTSEAAIAKIKSSGYDIHEEATKLLNLYYCE